MNTSQKNLAVVALLAALVVGTAVYFRTSHGSRMTQADREKIEALDDALRNGLISPSEYKISVEQIRTGNAQQGAPTKPTRAATLKEHLKAGLISQAEYDRKIKLLKPGATGDEVDVSSEPDAPEIETPAKPGIP